jgi:transcription initiation factor TFIIB
MKHLIILTIWSKWRGVSVGKDPMGLAAAVLFASCAKTGEQKSKIELANAGQTTDSTIRKQVKELKDRLDLHELHH